MSNDDTQLVQSRLSETHLAYLRAHAITDKVLAAADVSSDGDRVVFLSTCGKPGTRCTCGRSGRSRLTARPGR